MFSDLNHRWVMVQVDMTGSMIEVSDALRFNFPKHFKNLETFPHITTAAPLVNRIIESRFSTLFRSAKSSAALFVRLG